MVKRLAEFVEDVPLQYYKKMVVVNIPYKKITFGQLSTEAYITLELDGVEKTGCVPMSVVNTETEVVTATLHGQRGEMVWGRFPPTNDGSFGFTASVDSLENFERGEFDKW